MGVVEEHGQGAVACGSLELEVGCSLRGGVGTESMAHVVGPAISDICSLEGLLPALLDVDPAKGCFAGKNQWLLGIAVLVEALKFSDEGIAKGNATRAAIFAFFDESNPALKIDMSPFKIENFALARTCGKGEQDDTVEVGRFGLTRCGEQTGDLILRENTVAASILLEFYETKGRIFANPIEALGCVG